MKKIFAAILAFTVVFSFIFISCKKNSPKGSADNPIRFYFMPLKGEEQFKKYSPKMKQFIEANTGLAVEMVNSPDFITIVEAFGNNRCDAAFTNTLGYLMAHDWAKVEAYLRTLYGDVYDTYRGEILVRSDSGINDLKGLDGKTVAFADPFSAGGYLYALKLLNDKGVKPKKVLFAGGHEKAVEMIYNGEVDAAATYHERPTLSGEDRDARTELLKKYPDVIAKIKILALTDEIPTGPVAFAEKLPSDVKTRLAGALMGFARSSEGREALYNLYNVTGLTVGNDSDYNGVRKTLKDLGKTAEEVVPGGVTFYKINSASWLEY
jgi:phosphonate transport system substrate-binding protein